MTGLVELTGQVALVTGGSRGIGAAVCRYLGAAGAAVMVGYRREASLADAVAAEIVDGGGQARAAGADLNDAAAARALVAETIRAFGRLDILVNNAGTDLYRLIAQTTLPEWDDQLRLHMTAAFVLTQTVLPDMEKRGSGRIVNISSIWGQTGAAAEVAYSAAKSGLIGFTRALAREVAPYGITVNAVAPGAIATDMLGDLSSAERAELIRAIPAGRLGRPEDVAEVVRFLAGPGAGYITGQVVSPNGGWAMQ